MLKFFRRIRQNLLVSGHTKKYLWYAVGEIVLVVIGILIALQINNWNQNRINKQLERNYLENMMVNIQNDIRRMDAIVLDRYEGKMEGLTLAKAYNKGTLQVADTLDFLLKASYGAVFSNGVNFFSNQTFDELISTGNLQLIRDNELKTQINNYYGFVHNQVLNISHYKTDYIKMINSLRSFDENNPNHISPSDQKIMIEALKSLEFLQAVNLEMTYASRAYTILQGVSESAKDLLQTIQQYLKK